MERKNLPTLSLTFLHYLDEMLNQLTDSLCQIQKYYESTGLDLDSENADWIKGVPLCKQTKEQRM